MCIGLMILTGLTQQQFRPAVWFNNSPQTHFIWGCILFFLLQLISLAYTNDFYGGLSNIQKKSGLLFTPLAVVALNKPDGDKLKKLFALYCFLIFIAAIYLLCRASLQYMHVKNTSVFFYHSLVAPFRYHAVYFSILVFIALVCQVEAMITKTYVFHKSFHTLSILYLSFFLFLLASKLVLSYYAIYLLFLLIKSGQNHLSRLFIYTTGILLIFGTVFTLMTKNPVSDRFHDFTNGNISLIRQDKFSPSQYFNGLQFRLLQWRLVPEILSENNCWWTGVTPGDAQSFLNKKYISLNMYHGNAHREGHGYLDYHAHNQLLQSLLESGIPGGVVFIFICISLVRLARQVDKRLLSFTVVLLIIYLFVESLFEEQYGIVIFTFWPIFINQYYKPDPALRSHDRHFEKNL
jgi:O-antigen ligase